MKKIIVIDGQGGKLGKLIIEQLKASSLTGLFEVTAVGTNSIATAAMLKAGANNGATGENPVIVSCRNADIVVGPIGIIATDALHGEVTAAMAMAVGTCHAHKILVPVSRCQITIVGVASIPAAELVSMAVKQVLKFIGANENG